VSNEEDGYVLITVLPLCGFLKEELYSVCSHLKGPIYPYSLFEILFLKYFMLGNILK
jgi:hypothetical protein